MTLRVETNEDILLEGTNHGTAPSLWEEWISQLHTAIPTSISFAFYKIPWLLSLRFAGNIGNAQLAAASLASSICNTTGMSVAIGLNTAIVTLSGQSCGDVTSISNSPILYLYRGIIVDILFLLPVGMYFLYGISGFLLFIGIEQELALMTENYLRVLSLVLWPYAINSALTVFLQSLEMADIPAYTAFIGSILHVPFNLLFIYCFDWGYLGVAAATVMYQLIQPIMIVIYLKYIPRGRMRFESKCPKYIGGIFSIKGIVQYLSLAIPGLFVMIEWWCCELVIFLSASLSPYPSIALASMSIYQSINSALFMFPIGANVGGTTRVANFLGMGKHRDAKRSAFVCLLYTSTGSCAIALMLILTPHTLFPSFFTPDENIINMTANVIPLLALFNLANGIQSAFGGLLKACGRQYITATIVIISYCLIAVPFAYYLSFYLNMGEMYYCSYAFCGINGLVAGLVIGVWTQLMLMASYVFFILDWKTESDLALQRIGSAEHYITVTLSGADFPGLQVVQSTTPRTPRSPRQNSAFDFVALDSGLV